MTVQDKINEIQALYKEWQNLYTRLQITCQDLQKSQALIKQMENFYFDGYWSEIYEQMENGLEVDLTTDGEYSIMSEDTLWNAFHDQQGLLWQFLRTAIKALDKDAPDFYEKDNTQDGDFANQGKSDILAD